MRHTPGLKEKPQSALGGFVAEQVWVGARQRRPVPGCVKASTSRTPSRCRTAAATARPTLSISPRGINQHATAGILGGDRPKSGAQPLVKGTVEPLEAVLASTAAGYACQPVCDRQVENQSQIRHKIADRKTMCRH